MSYNTKIPNFNTMADLFDRLIVCVNKLAFFENEKREAQGILNRDPDHGEHTDRDNKTLNLIAYWDNASRNECEIRNLLKREIDRMFAQAVEEGEYKALPDFRTFRASEKTIADILAEQCDEIGVSTKAKLEENWS